MASLEAAARAARGRLGRPCRYVRECASTQDLLRDPALPHGAVAVAEHQTAGRGRSGRRWEDAPGTALLCSALLRPAPGASLPELSLVVALGAARAIEAAAGRRALVKWPNDVLVEGRKVAGILLEGREGAVVAGIGVNVNQAEGSLPTGAPTPAGSLRTVTGREHDRGALFTALLEEIDAAFTRWERGGLAELLPELEQRNALRGRRVESSAGRGTAGPLAPDGRLRVLLDDGGERLLASGEVVLAPASSDAVPESRAP